MDCGCIKPLCDLLSTPDVRIVTVALEGLENILKVGVAVSAGPDGDFCRPAAYSTTCAPARSVV